VYSVCQSPPDTAQSSIIILNIKFHQNLATGIQAVPCRTNERTDGHDDDNS
jgi:hypothetical protein